MKHYAQKELTPVNYGLSPVKILRFAFAQNKIGARLHWHDRMELLLVDSGVMLLNVDGREFAVEAGEVGVVNCGQLHAIRSAEALSYRVFMFEPANLSADQTEKDLLLSPLLEGTLRFDVCIRDDVLTETLDEITAENDEEKVGYPLYIKSLVYRLLGRLYRFHTAREPAAIPVDRALFAVMRAIDARFSEPLTVENLAREFGYDAAYFCRKFKRGTGLSPMRYIHIRRLEHAEQLLTSTDDPCADIALACGFADANYFARLFKKVYGMSPTARRAAAKREIDL